MVVLTAYDELENDDDQDGEGVGVDEEVLGGGVYRGQSVLVDLHCVIVTVAVIYMVLVVVCATADKTLVAKIINDEACILTGFSLCLYFKPRMERNPDVQVGLP